MGHPVQRNRFSDQIRKLLGIKGHVGLAMLDDVMPVIDIVGENPEDLQPRDEDRFSGGSIQAAVAAEYQGAAVYNPLGSSRIVIVEGMVAWSGVNQLNAGLFWDIAGWTAFAAGGKMDSRITTSKPATVPETSSLCQTYRRSNALKALASGGYAWGFPILSATDKWVDLQTPWILAPGWGLAVESTAVNAGMTCYFKWRERPIDSEI